MTAMRFSLLAFVALLGVRSALAAPAPTLGGPTKVTFVDCTGALTAVRATFQDNGFSVWQAERPAEGFWYEIDEKGVDFTKEAGTDNWTAVVQHGLTAGDSGGAMKWKVAPQQDGMGLLTYEPCTNEHGDWFVNKFAPDDYVAGDDLTVYNQQGGACKKQCPTGVSCGTAAEALKTTCAAGSVFNSAGMCAADGSACADTDFVVAQAGAANEKCCKAKPAALEWVDCSGKVEKVELRIANSGLDGNWWEAGATITTDEPTGWERVVEAGKAPLFRFEPADAVAKATSAAMAGYELVEGTRFKYIVDGQEGTSPCSFDWNEFAVGPGKTTQYQAKADGTCTASCAEYWTENKKPFGIPCGSPDDCQSGECTNGACAAPAPTASCGDPVTGLDTSAKCEEEAGWLLNPGAVCVVSADGDACAESDFVATNHEGRWESVCCASKKSTFTFIDCKGEATQVQARFRDKYGTEGPGHDWNGANPKWYWSGKGDEMSQAFDLKKRDGADPAQFFVDLPFELTAHNQVKLAVLRGADPGGDPTAEGHWSHKDWKFDQELDGKRCTNEHGEWRIPTPDGKAAKDHLAAVTLWDQSAKGGVDGLGGACSETCAVEVTGLCVGNTNEPDIQCDQGTTPMPAGTEGRTKAVCCLRHTTITYHDCSGKATAVAAVFEDKPGTVGWTQQAPTGKEWYGTNQQMRATQTAGTNDWVIEAPFTLAGDRKMKWFASEDASPPAAGAPLDLPAHDRKSAESCAYAEQDCSLAALERCTDGNGDWKIPAGYAAGDGTAGTPFTVYDMVVAAASGVAASSDCPDSGLVFHQGGVTCPTSAPTTPTPTPGTTPTPTPDTTPEDSGPPQECGPNSPTKDATCTCTDADLPCKVKAEAGNFHDCYSVGSGGLPDGVSPVTADDPKCEAKEEVITASASKPAATALATLLVAATCWAAH